MPWGSDGEVPLQSVRSALHEPGERDGGGVRGDDGTGPAHRVEPRVEIALHVEALHHRLDDPVGLTGSCQIVVDVADVDAPGRAAVHEGRRGTCGVSVIDTTYFRDGVAYIPGASGIILDNSGHDLPLHFRE